MRGGVAWGVEHIVERNADDQPIAEGRRPRPRDRREVEAAYFGAARLLRLEESAQAWSDDTRGVCPVAAIDACGRRRGEP